jgi:RNA polymerase sigma-70 factor (ECF subfamily)
LLPQGDLLQSDATGDAGHLEDLERLKHALDVLPLKLKQPVVLHYMQHLTIAEAAEALDVRQGTLKSRLNRGLEALRKDMGGR